MTYCWKALDEDYNFDLNLISIQGLYEKLWAPKVARVPTLAISGLALGSLETKCNLDVRFVERRKVYYKGEGGGFSSSGRGEFCESKLPMFCPNTKSAPTMH